MRSLAATAFAYLLTAIPASAQDFRLENLLTEEDLFLFASLNDPGEVVAEFKKTPLHTFLNAPDLKAFLDSIHTSDGEFERALHKSRTWVDETEKELGEPLYDSLSSVGSVSLALGGLESKEPVLVITVDLKEDSSLESTLRKLVESTFDDSWKRTKKEIDGIETVLWESGSKACVFGQRDSILFLTSTEDLAHKLLRCWTQHPKNALAQSPAYQHALKSLPSKPGSLFCFLSMRPLLDKAKEENKEPAFTYVLNALNAESLNYLALNVHFEKGQGVCTGHLNADLSSTPSLLEDSIFNKTPAELERECLVCQVSQQALAPQIEALYALLAQAGPAIAAEGSFEFDLSKFPIGSLTEHGGMTRQASVLTPSGITFVARSDLGLPFPSFGGSGPASTGILAAILLPAIAKARERAKAASGLPHD